MDQPHTPMEEVSIDATDIPCGWGYSVEHAGTDLSSGGAVLSTVERIFEDLMLGVRVEEALNHQFESLRGGAGELYAGDEVGGEEAWLETEEVLSIRWFRALGTDLMDTVDTVARAELAQALVVLGESCPESPILGADEKNLDYRSSVLVRS